ncbi:PucR family transcriptional regulator [Paenibacillus turpanensis]|uniref:PucR family transcriptional regulator n=1 Tax=Paenibacillus turpanensis TaxID=2689078 RepID=UPI001407BE67|nr:helix-turn-helix domain-containing protein [Paenibacillus turpanensis]
MHWEPVVAKLERILQTDMEMKIIPKELWLAWGGQEAMGEISSIAAEGSRYFKLTFLEPDSVLVLGVSADELRDREIRLIELFLLTQAEDTPALAVESYDEERMMTELGQQLMKEIRSSTPGLPMAPLAEPYALLPSLRQGKLPFLVAGEFPDTLQTSYSERVKLLESFFDEDVTLIPLQENEWVVLAPESLLTAAGDGDEEGLEDGLASLASGLHDMIEGEWGGKSYVAVTYPCKPSEQLPQVSRTLRETMGAGRRFDAAQPIYLPWKLRLELLLSSLPEAEKLRFAEQILGRGEPVLDTETLQTLDTFFSLDCNVSETAKKLYIHRNTLLYRLDKIKQETAIDVRSFEGAVLMKLALLLYKVTKRK